VRSNYNPRRYFVKPTVGYLARNIVETTTVAFTDGEIFGEFGKFVLIENIVGERGI